MLFLNLVQNGLLNTNKFKICKKRFFHELRSILIIYLYLYGKGCLDSGCDDICIAFEYNIESTKTNMGFFANVKLEQV